MFIGIMFEVFIELGESKEVMQAYRHIPMRQRGQAGRGEGNREEGMFPSETETGK